jgi:MFS family permease
VAILARLADAYGVHDARAYGRTPWLLAMGTLLVGTGRGIVGPLIVVFLQGRGLSLGIIGLGILVEFLLRACVGPMAGALSDRVGRRPMMIAGLAATSVILPCYLLVRTPAQFLALSVVNGLFAAHSLYGPASNAMVVDVVPAGRRGAVFGLVHSARNLGWIVGLGVFAALVAFNPSLAFLVAALLPASALVLTLLLIREPPRAPRVRAPVLDDWRAILRRPAFRAYLVLSLGIYLGQGMLNTILPPFLTEGLGQSLESLVLVGVNAVIIVLFQIPVGRFADRADRARMLALACAVLAVTDGILAAADQFRSVGLALVLLAIVVFSFAEMLWSPVLTAFPAELAPEGMTGSALGLLAFSNAVGQSGPSFLADLLVPVGGWGLVWLALGAVCAPCAVGMLLLGRRLTKGRAANPEGAEPVA